MLIDIKSKIFYPSHGAGWVVGQRIIEFAGEKRKYFEFELINNPLTISTPISNVDILKIRGTTEQKKIMSLLKELKKHQAVNPKIEDYNLFIDEIKRLDNEGVLEGFVTIIQYCNFIRQQRVKDNKVVPANIIKYIKLAKEYIVCELAVASDQSYEDALELFEQETGIREIK